MRQNNNVSYLNSLSKINQVQAAFIAFCAGLALISGAGLPTLTFLSILGIMGFLRSLRNPVSIPADPSQLLLWSIVFILSGLHFYGLYPLSQLIVLPTMGAIVGFYYIQTVLRAHSKINDDLRSAVSELNLEKTKDLLLKGADPYTVDAYQNTAFHLVIQNHPKAQEVLDLLKNQSQKVIITFSDIFQPFENIFNPVIEEKGRSVLHRLQQLMQKNSISRRNHFYQDLIAFLDGFKVIFKNFSENLTSYLIQKLKSEKNIRVQNLMHHTPADFLRIKELEPEIKTALGKLISEMESEARTKDTSNKSNLILYRRRKHPAERSSIAKNYRKKRTTPHT